ncbi:uncharacterized protein EDB91DRAFT_539010 [Suillus paluster]|uniref:uncharacterized protein n=1 Tax=Suillus paluster TaxID=48578 RepID=UPI001B85C852|nr:uncharacterized protein EDB91DRAFT_539010 [Suillus paluster]KAG1736132.1 hypothetical protein EDB91DRAFT_539010 [Suillus paluster]
MPLSFGRGRWICVGRHLADASPWIAIASFLAISSQSSQVLHWARYVCRIPSVPESNLLISYLSHAEKFPCRIVPRFPNAPAKTLMHLTGLVAEQSRSWHTVPSPALRFCLSTVGWQRQPTL